MLLPFPTNKVSASPESTSPVAEIDFKRSRPWPFSKPEYQTVMARQENQWAGFQQQAELQQIQNAEATEKNLVINPG